MATKKKAVVKKEAPKKAVTVVKLDTAAKVQESVVELLATISKQLENFGNIANQTNWLINEFHKLANAHNEMVTRLNTAFGTELPRDPSAKPVTLHPSALAIAGAKKPDVEVVPQGVNGAATPAQSQKQSDMGF